MVSPHSTSPETRPVQRQFGLACLCIAYVLAWVSGILALAGIATGDEVAPLRLVVSAGVFALAAAGAYALDVARGVR